MCSDSKLEQKTNLHWHKQRDYSKQKYHNHQNNASSCKIKYIPECNLINTYSVKVDQEANFYKCTTFSTNYRAQKDWSECMKSHAYDLNKEYKHQESSYLYFSQNILTVKPFLAFINL